MEILIWLAIIAPAVALLIWYGYGLMTKKPDANALDGTSEVAKCHLCRRELPVREMITREKAAGFENHFCGDCIEELYRDLIRRHPVRAMPGRN
jgi:hypothetical protein